jgi:hypothetical protein
MVSANIRNDVFLALALRCFLDLIATVSLLSAYVREMLLFTLQLFGNNFLVSQCCEEKEIYRQVFGSSQSSVLLSHRRKPDGGIGWEDGGVKRMPLRISLVM